MKSVFARSFPAALAATLIALSGARAEKPQTKTENVLFVMTDGLRWQEVFSGAEESLLNKARGGVQDVARLRKDFWRDTPEARREALMPFLWGTVAKQGQIFGNRRKGSAARVTNGLNFSYPGYTEVLCGYEDPRIDSNEKIPNPNVTILEWLHEKEAFKGRIAAFASWDVFPYIFNVKRSGLPVNSGYQPLTGVPETPRVRLLNELMTEIPPLGEETRRDALTFRAAKEYLLVKKPRVLYVAFDQTDEQGHAGRYDRVLDSAHKVDGFIKDLWDTLQAMPEYRGKTSLVLAVDHGRGDPPVDWKNHGRKTAGSEATWIAFLGPDTPALGERKDVPEVTQSQIAATLAALLGQDYCAAVPKAGKPIDGVVDRGGK
jgi:Type I phosphodiesterase / nucleotide pyrophosphatase